MDDPTGNYVALLGAAEQALDDVEAALVRLDEGTYGTCEACGAPIDEGRLAALPTARSCGGHPQLADANRPTPSSDFGPTA